MRSQAAALRRGQTPELNLRLSPLEPEPSKENSIAMSKQMVFLLASTFLFPWLVECQSGVPKKGWMSGGKGIEFGERKR